MGPVHDYEALPVRCQIAVAAAFRVAWRETNQQHAFEIEVADADGVGVVKFGGQFEAGRPPGTPPGQDQRTQIAVNLELPLKRLGTYVVVARLNGEERRTFLVQRRRAPQRAAVSYEP